MHSKDSDQTGCTRHMPFCWFCHEVALIVSFVAWQTSLHNELERLQDSICSDSTMFHLQSSSIILGKGNNYGVPEDATCDYLPVCVTESEEEFSGRKKKSEKQIVNMKLNGFI